MFAINIEFAAGVAHLDSRAYNLSGRAEWPPHPDRLFMALIATAFRNGDASRVELQALEWLEQQDPPCIQGSTATPRPSFQCYVPTNDDGTKFDKRRKAKTLSSVVPDSTLVSYLWNQTPPTQIKESLARLVERVTYLGRSESIVVGHVSESVELESGWIPADKGREQFRIPYPGRLQELRDCYAAGIRPTPAAWASYQYTADKEVIRGEWDDLLVLELNRKLKLTECLVLSQAVRKVVMAVCVNPLPEWISGHADDGSASRNSHISILPLADVGHRFASGLIYGIAIAVPGIVPRPEISATFAGVTNKQLYLDARTELRPVANPRRCLLPETWTRPSRQWTTVTPIALHRWPKKKVSLESLVMQGIEMAELPRPQSVKISRVSSLRGGLGESLDQAPNKYRLHATITWGERITGPILLGALRYQGLGLCKPI